MRSRSPTFREHGPQDLSKNIMKILKMEGYPHLGGLEGCSPNHFLVVELQTNPCPSPTTRVLDIPMQDAGHDSFLLANFMHHISKLVITYSKSDSTGSHPFYRTVFGPVLTFSWPFLIARYRRF